MWYVCFQWDKQTTTSHTITNKHPLEYMAQSNTNNIPLPPLRIVFAMEVPEGIDPFMSGVDPFQQPFTKL